MSLAVVIRNAARCRKNARPRRLRILIVEGKADATCLLSLLVEAVGQAKSILTWRSLTSACPTSMATGWRVCL
jgi:hypothetical protein